jgi:GDP-mannose pyrophosphatase NudK
MTNSLLVLVAGPYRSGTDDLPERIAANVRAMSDMALRVYARGHLPVLGEWLALPLLETAGSTHLGDAVFTQFFHPVAIRLLDHCDAVLRIGGPSAGADEMVRLGREKGLLVFHALDDLPAVPA